MKNQTHWIGFCLVLALGLILQQTNLFGAEDRPRLAMKVALVHPELGPEETEERNIVKFDKYFRNKNYVPEIIRGATPETVLENYPNVSVVIGGSFRVSDGEVLAFIYWRPDGIKWSPDGRVDVPKSTGSTDPVDGAAIATEQYINLKLFDDVTKHLKHITKTKIENDILNATEHTAQGNFEKALKLSKPLLGSGLDNNQQYRIHYILGFCYKKLNQLDAAWEHASQAHELNTDDDSAIFEQGNIAFLQGKLDLAESLYGKVRAKRESNADKARFNLALIYQSQGDWDKALAELGALPENFDLQLDKTSLSNSISDAKKKFELEQQRRVNEQQQRADFFRRLMTGLVVMGVIVASITIFVLYRRLQRTPELTSQQKADHTGKLMSGLFNVLTLLGGTMLGAMLTK